MRSSAAPRKELLMKTIVYENENLVVVDMKSQYGDGLVGNKRYAVVTDLPEEVIRNIYSDILLDYEPYQVVGGYYIDCINEYKRNLDLQDKHKKRYGVSISLEDILWTISDGKDLVYQEERKELITQLYYALSKLTAPQKRRVILRYWEKMSISEIAELEGRDWKTIKESLKAAIKRLKKYF